MENYLKVRVCMHEYELLRGNKQQGVAKLCVKTIKGGGDV